MGFIAQNYVWFIVGGVVILMAVIGYIAEKTDYATKKFGEKDVKKKEENAQNIAPVQNNVSNVADASEMNNDFTSQPQMMSNNEYNYDNLNIGLMDSINKINNTESVGVEDPVMNTTNVEVNAQAINSSDIENNDINNMEDLYAPLNPKVEEKEEDLTAPLVSGENSEVTTNEAENYDPVNSVDGLYMPPEIEPANDTTDEKIYPTDDSIALESVEPYNLDIQNDEEENVDSEDYHKMFPENPIIIGDKKEEETKEENEDVWSN